MSLLEFMESMRPKAAAKSQEKKGPKKVQNTCNTESVLTKQESSRKNWRFTLNNYTEDEIVSLVQWFKEMNAKYFFGKEIGEEKETPHLQGYAQFPKKYRRTALSKHNQRISWRTADASKKSNITYCSKESEEAYSEIFTNMRLPKKQNFPVFNKPWQLEILQIISTDPDDRTIHWYWEDIGGIGKTTFCKYLDIHHNATCVPSKTNDAFHMIAKEVEAENLIDLVIFDIPRHAADSINYGAIEAIKNGFLVSGKYEGLKCNFKSPHVIVFANQPPNERKMSADRWRIIEIKSE